MSESTNNEEGGSTIKLQDPNEEIKPRFSRDVIPELVYRLYGLKVCVHTKIWLILANGSYIILLIMFTYLTWKFWKVINIKLYVYREQNDGLYCEIMIFLALKKFAQTVLWFVYFYILIV